MTPQSTQASSFEQETVYVPKKRRAKRPNWLVGVVLLVVIFCIVLPFYWMVAASLKSRADVLAFPPLQPCEPTPPGPAAPPPAAGPFNVESIPNVRIPPPPPAERGATPDPGLAPPPQPPF